MACIYEIKNLCSSKIYIGSTIRNAKERKAEHYKTLKNNTHCNIFLQRAYNKVGKDNIMFNVIEDIFFPDFYDKVLKSEYITGRELHLINLLNPVYNIKKETGIGNSGFTHSKETKDKIRERSLQKDNMDRMPNFSKLGNESWKGRHHSKESKIKMLKTKFNCNRVIEIYKKDSNQFLYSCNFTNEASRLTGVSLSAIKNNLVNLSKSSGGFIFKYKYTI